MDTRTGEVYSYDSQEALEKAKEENPDLDEIPYREFEKMVSMTPQQRLEYHHNKKVKTRSRTKLAKKSKQRNRR